MSDDAAREGIARKDELRERRLTDATVRRTRAHLVARGDVALDTNGGTEYRLTDTGRRRKKTLMIDEVRPAREIDMHMTML